VAHIFIQDRRGDRPGMRPDLGLRSWPRAPPQPRHSAMGEVTPPVPHRADMYPEHRGDLLGLPPLQRQQDRPRPVRLAAMLRFRQRAQGRLFRGISRQRRFSRHACLHSPSSQANNPFRRPFAGSLLRRRRYKAEPYKHLTLVEEASYLTRLQIRLKDIVSAAIVRDENAVLLLVRAGEERRRSRHNRMRRRRESDTDGAQSRDD